MLHARAWQSEDSFANRYCPHRWRPPTQLIQFMDPQQLPTI